MNLILHRTDLRQDCTLGVLELIPHQDSPIPVFTCATLEPSLSPFRTPSIPRTAGAEILPEVGKGAIPPGRYRITFRPSSHFARQMPFLENVPGFTGIMIHPGNTARDTKGCILVGQPSGSNRIVNSRKTFADLEALLLSAKDPIWITICN